jgi:hypothetical protein
MQNLKQIAQWVIDNRYPKSESEKVSDFEIYHTILESLPTIEEGMAAASNVVYMEGYTDEQLTFFKIGFEECLRWIHSHNKLSDNPDNK